MPRRLLGVFMFLLVPVSLLWAQGDVVLLTVGGEDVSLSEFRYHWCKSSEKRADVFAEKYGRFKQKVLCAKELGLDTLSSYSSQRAVCLSWLSKGQKALQARKWIRLLHVTYPLKQNSSQRDLDAGFRMMDSLYVELKSSVFNGDMSEEYWIQERYLLDEWKDCLANLAKGEVSQPFLSPLGIHVVAWTDKKVGHFSEEGTGCTDLFFRKKEIEESLLVVFLNEFLLKSISCTEAELMKCFKENRGKYGGGVPHFKGAVIHCRNKKEAKAIKKLLRKYPETLWEEVLKEMADEMPVKCKIDVGLFKIGRNPYVDKLAFDCGEYEVMKDYPYSFVLGKKMRKGPGSYLDVRQRVEKDCLEAKKIRQIENYMQKYELKINKEQLKSVNRAKNK